VHIVMQKHETANQLLSGLTRRGFHRLAVGSVASLALVGCARRSALGNEQTKNTSLAYADEPSVPVLLCAVPRAGGNEAIEKAVRRAALAASDFSWLSRGDTVVIKPVCNSGNVYPATTDPAALRAMIALLREKGARRVVVADMSGVEFVRFTKDGLRGSTRELMRRNGMAQSVEAAGGEVHAFEEQGWDAFFEDGTATGGSWSKPIMLPNLLREVDHVVLMPRCARHLLAGTTLGLKAAVGWWRHDSRLEYHRNAGTFSQKTAEANTVATLRAKQRLVLSSATKILTTYGPDRGYVAEPETGLVIASTSVVAHDMVSLAWLLENRAAMPAHERDGMIDDPNTSSAFVNVANHVVAGWLGGFGAALKTEWLTRYDLDRVWDDRVLHRAFEVFGGVPRIDLVDPDRGVPENLKSRLGAELTLPV